MLLPSDVARLVLGYLQQEGLITTSRAFIMESPNLREYADHTSEDGLIPACVFSLFGKNLITILNEYVSAKAKETCQENHIPAMMSSLWKKLDYTLNQIKSLQNAPGLHAQRIRTHNSIQNMRRLRALSSCPAPVTANIIVSGPGNCVASPLVPAEGILGTTVCYAHHQARPSSISLSQPAEAPLQIMLPDIRLTPGPLSPARRKCDSPRRRGGIAVSSVLPVEAQSQEAVTENLSQMVIENARERILNDRSLQEKLAENINKILASDPSPQMARATCSTVEQEQSIDEILGLQGEIHMTDDAIQDILEQTESDPAFQALFDLFDHGKGKAAEAGEEAEGTADALQTPEPGPPPNTWSAGDTVNEPEDSLSGAETATRSVSSVKEVKSRRKAAARPVPAPSRSKQTTRGGTQTKKPASRRRVSVNAKQAKSTSSSPVDKKSPTMSNKAQSGEEGGMEMDDPSLETSRVVSTERTPSPVSQTGTITTETPASTKQAETTAEPTTDGSGEKSGAEKEKIITEQTVGPSDVSIPSINKPTTRGQRSATYDLASLDLQPGTNEISLSDAVPQEKETSVGASPLAPVVSESAATAVSSLDVGVSSSEPGKVVSLKIVVSDEDAQGGDAALTQAVSSISVDRFPTIFLSPPNKSPAKVPPVPTSSSITAEETAQAVDGLRGAEAAGDRIVSASNNLQTFHAPAVSQETGLFQLFPSSPAFRGTSSYFVVTDSGTTVDQRSGVTLLPATTPTGATPTPQLASTPPGTRAAVSFAPNVSLSPTASALVVSSAAQPQQNVTVFHNQILPLPGPTLGNPPAKVVPKPKLVPTDGVDLGKAATSGFGQAVNDLQGIDAISASAASPGHRRMLCFDENSGQTNSNISSASNTKERPRAERNPPGPLGGNAKRRIETIRLPNQSPETVEPNKPFVPPLQDGSSKSAGTGTDWVDACPSSGASTTSDAEGAASLSTATDLGRDIRSGVGRTRSEKSGTVKDASKDDPLERRPSKPPEGAAESVAAANKENEASGGTREPRQAGAHSLRSQTPLSQGGSGKPTCKTSPLTKQAAEMLQDIQSQSPVSTPPRRKGAGASDLPVPRTPGPGRVQEDYLDALRTPSRQKQGREAEGTPKRTAPPATPATPDLPSCSPASEAGSENSINMAAHTLMILSRAARTGGPLKDSLRQEEVGAVGAEKSNPSKGKKRKHAEQNPTARKELQHSGSTGSKKKAKKDKKKLLDSFPHDLDVDKFLSSLHYDE